MNSITITGNLGHDPSLRSLPDGSNVCTFSVAVRRTRKDQGPLWLEVSTFGKQALACKQYLAKGHQVGISGSLDIRQYTGRDGTPKMSVTIQASQVDFLGSDQKPVGQMGQSPGQPPASTQPKIDDEDIPF